MAAADGPPKRAAAAALLTDGALVVAAARLAHFLQIAPLCDAALDAIGSALDRSNAPSILLLARELGSRPLEERAVTYAAAQLGAIRRKFWRNFSPKIHRPANHSHSFRRYIVAELDAVSVEGEHWAELPSATRELFRFLRDAATRNPLSKDHGGATTSVADARELLGMTREALHAMVERLCDARDREAENRADRAVAGEPASWTRRLADFLGSAPPPPPPPPPQPSREELSLIHI